jgi:thiosulfate/3-mercaptopyruvate sulfurtransferase
MSLIRMLVLLLISLVLACGTPGETSNQEKLTPVAESPPTVVREFMLVSTGWLATELKNENVVVLHVATSPKNYETGHIPGAHYLGWEQLATTVDGVLNEIPSLEALTELVRSLGIDRDKRVVIYDEENGIRAARVYFTLDYLGLGGNSSLLNGQLAIWKEEGLPLSNEAPTAVHSDFEPTVNERIIVRMNELVAMVGGEGMQGKLLDCRPPDQFSGENPGKGIVRGGHLPGAQNLPALKTVISAENPLFLSPDKLRELFRKAGLNTDRPTVTYCRTGRSASLHYFALKYLGYDARLYDGSFSQWQATESNPVATGQ